MSEITERKSKEVEKLNNEVTILKVKLEEKERQVEGLRDENLKLFEQSKDIKKK